MGESIELYADSLGSNHFECREFVKEFTPLGKRYSIVLNGDRAELDAIGEEIHAAVASGYKLNAIPNLAAAVVALIPDSVLARTPRLVYKGEGNLADLVIMGEEGIQEGFVQLGDPNTPNTSAFEMPPNVSSRFVYEPNDVALAYGLPFRAGFKWDLEAIADNLDFEVTYYQADPEDPEAAPLEIAQSITEMMKVIGHTASTMSLLAMVNVWREGSITEQQRGALYSYLADENGGGEATQEYVKRILRGQDSFRFWVPNVTVTRRWKKHPGFAGLEGLSHPGEISYLGEDSGPPEWSGAPDSYFGTGDDTDIFYEYWATGPQLEMTGEGWVTEEQWNGFLSFDSALYDDPRVEA